MPGKDQVLLGSDMKEFKDKVAVITGAASGIGKGLAARCASEGMKVVLADVDKAGLEQLSAQLGEGGTPCLTLPTDVSAADQVEILAQAAVDTFGSVDLVFNNAGVMLTGPSWEKSEAEWDWILGVNLKGVINGMRSFVPRMLAQGSDCHMVNTSSLAGFLAAPYMAPYTVSKYAVRGLTETLHYELAMMEAKLKVSVLCPGQVATGIMDSGQDKPAAKAAAEGQIQMDDYLRTEIAAGMDPGQCADIVFEAIREERFWIFPHPHFKPAFQAAMEEVLSETNPVFSPMAL